MKKLFFDFSIIFGIILAHLLLFFSFHDRTIFWYIFSGSILILIIFAIMQENAFDQLPSAKYLPFGLISGALLYVLFWLGYQVIGHYFPSSGTSVARLYRWYGPSLFWHYISLFLVAAPGEELFWRGFIQRKFQRYYKPVFSIIATSLLYASVNLYSGSFLLVFSAFFSGVIWGTLYWWKKSMPLVIVSHLTFDLLMFVIAPLT
jgi:membrane protease YdiL (CAAX protease family)